MDERETEALMDDVAAVMRALVAKATKPLIEKIDALEAKIAGLPAPKETKALAADITPFLPDYSKAIGAIEAYKTHIDAMRERIEEFTANLADVGKQFGTLNDEMGTLRNEVAAVPAGKDGRDGTAGPKGDPGADGINLAGAMIDRTGALILTLSDGTTRELGQVVGKDGASFTAEDAAPIIAEEVAKSIAGIRQPENGRDGKDGKDADPELIKTMIAEAVAALPPAEKGKDADPAETAALVREEVQRAVAALPVPKDGVSVTVEDVRPLIEAEVSKAVTLIPVPKDGIDAMDVMIDREGNLVFTMSDGRLKNVGLVVGRDGADVDMVAVKEKIAGEFASLPKPKDGVDGIGFDDIDLVETDAGVFLRCVRGENVKEWRLPVMRYRGVFKDGQVYRRGDTVTWGGSLWHCDADGTDDKPDGPTKSWTLASKRGRDGKDGGTK